MISCHFKYVPMLPNMIPFSVEATLTLALMLQKSWGASINGEGFSTSFRSPVIYEYEYTMKPLNQIQNKLESCKNQTLNKNPM